LTEVDAFLLEVAERFSDALTIVILVERQRTSVSGRGYPPRAATVRSRRVGTSTRRPEC